MQARKSCRHLVIMLLRLVPAELKAYLVAMGIGSSVDVSAPPGGSNITLQSPQECFQTKPSFTERQLLGRASEVTYKSKSFL